MCSLPIWAIAMNATNKELRSWSQALMKIKAYQLLLVIVGAFFSAFAVAVFVRAANLVPGGLSGLSILLIKEIYAFNALTVPFGLIYLLLNLCVIAFVYRHIGKRFLMLSLLHVFLTSIFVELIPPFPLTDDIILLTVFGGITNAIGSLCALKAHASAGGTDFIAVAYSRLKNRPIWNQVMFFNIMLLVYSGARYDWQMALYSIIYQFVSISTVSAYHNHYKLTRLHIITKLPDEVSKEILSRVRHGITKQAGIGMFNQSEQDVLYMVINDYEVETVIAAVLSVDPRAFIEISKVERIVGNYYQKPID